MTSYLSSRSLPDVLSHIVDNRGRTCPTVTEGFPLIATNCLKPGQRWPVYENVRYVDEETRRDWFRSHLAAGDILFVCKGTPGRLAVVPDPVPFCIAQDMVGLRADRSEVDSIYLYYRLLCPDVQTSIGNMHVGTMIPHFKRGDFGKLRFTIHSSMTEQRAISGVLSALDDKIAANDRVVSAGDRIAGALMLDCASNNLVSIATLAGVTMGSSPSGESYSEVADGTPFYQGVRDFGVRSPTRRIWTTAPVRTAEESDTLVSVRAPVGQTNLANEHLCIGRGLAGLRSKKGLPMTLFHQVRIAREVWTPYQAEGTIFGSINRRQLESVLVPAVEETKAEFLEGQLTTLEKRIAAAVRENERLAVTRGELLPLLMSGRARVRDAEKVVEEVV